MLTLSGAADRAGYAQLLSSLYYSDTAASPATGQRKINIVADDGIAGGPPATATVEVLSQPLSAAAVDALLGQGGNGLSG